MSDCKLKQDIKKILTDGTFWMHETDLNKTIDSLHDLMDLERLKTKTAQPSTLNEHRERNGLGSDE